MPICLILDRSLRSRRLKLALAKDMSDLRFNRTKTKGQRVYLDAFDRSQRKFGDERYTGFVKCKLVHGKGYSLVIPDQIYLQIGGDLNWIQPIYFAGSVISRLDHGDVCDLTVDISHGNLLKIRFETSDLISRLKDGSFLYRCSILAPNFLYRYTTGAARLKNGRPLIKLFHHTNAKFKKSILKGRHFRTSAWNIQGNKKCTNVAFLYMTSLPKIEHVTDLQQIAMSHLGKMAFRLDTNYSDIPDLVLTSERQSTNDRTHSIEAWVYADALAPQPCFRHLPPAEPGYHEVVSPFIHRIPSQPGGTVSIQGGHLRPKEFMPLHHAVVGDAMTISGLRAPYDEEHTSELLKIEQIAEPGDVMSFWLENPNMNHYDGKNIEALTFEGS